MEVENGAASSNFVKAEVDAKRKSTDTGREDWNSLLR